jgi:hypothetical protein
LHMKLSCLHEVTLGVWTLSKPLSRWTAMVLERKLI